MDVSTAQQWLMYFSSGNSNVCEKWDISTSADFYVCMVWRLLFITIEDALPMAVVLKKK